MDVIKSTLLKVIDTLYYRETPPPPPSKAFLPDSSDIFFEISIGPYLEDASVNRDSLIKADSLAQAKHNRRWFDSVTQAYKTFDWEQYRIDSIKWRKSLDEPRPEKRIVLLVSDSLVSNRTGNIDEVTNLGFEKDFEISLEGDYAELVNQLLDSSVSPIPIDFDNFPTIGKYHIEPESYEPTSNDRVVASIILSRVVFNDQRTKAAYYYQEFPGLLDGHGYVVFVELTKSGWKVSGMNMIWIS